MAEIRQKATSIKGASFWFALTLCLFGLNAHAQKKSNPATTEPAGSGTRLSISGKFLHLSCSRSIRDLKNNRLECFGNVYIRRPAELLTSDYAILDMGTEQLHAEGNVVYFTPSTVIYGSKMDFNFLTEIGTVEDGRIESDKYQLLGEKIERLGVDHFRATDGEYTTCRDCPASWKLVGRTIDLTVNGYAKLSHVFVKLNEAPSMYLPYMVVPVKTTRQSGLLFPRFQPKSSNGFTYIQPYYWAISRSQDATLAGGTYSRKGIKGEGEYRYVLGNRSKGQLNAFYLRDRDFIRAPFYSRWAINYNHTLELPWGFDQKLNYIDTSDRDYARKIGDVPGLYESSYISEASLSKSSRTASGWITSKRIRNLITPGLTGFDYNTVQVLPSVTVSSTDHTISDDLHLHYGATFNFSRFWRKAPSFDPIYPQNFTPPSQDFFLPTGQTPLRKGQRFNLVPEIYYTQKVGDYLEFIPSVQYRSFYYLFDNGVAPPTSRGYLLTQAEVSTTVEKVYGSSFKHKFRPSLIYSNIPFFYQDGKHPFIRQLNTAGYQFDDNDIVPISSDNQLYFIPLGNSLTYRFGNKLIVKDKGAYQKMIDLSAGQTVNFIEYRKNGDRRPLSRFYSMLTVDTLRFQGRAEYYFYPYVNQPTYNVSFNYIFAKYFHRLLSFERSINLHYNYNQVLTSTQGIGGGYNFSFSELFGMTANIEYQFPSTYGKFPNQVETPGRILSISSGLTYQSPSQCYRIVALAGWTSDNKELSLTWSIPVNLTGEGFANLQEGGGLVPGGASPGI